MHTNLSSLFPADRERLNAYRRAARDVHRLLRKEYDRNIGVGPETSLIPETVLRSASQPLRLVTLEQEAAYLPDVLTALRRLQDLKVTAEADRIESAFHRVRGSKMHMQWIDQKTSRAFAYGGWNLVELWFYGKSFHQDPDRQDDLERLRDFGEFGVMELQIIILKLGAVVFALDTLIAKVLDEDSLAEVRAAAGDVEEFF